jgi:hypothetical protein
LRSDVGPVLMTARSFLPAIAPLPQVGADRRISIPIDREVASILVILPSRPNPYHHDRR